jgi:acetolactate synthase I/III small subunit
MNKEYTIIAFTENHVGLLNRITIIFTRRHINIESLTVSPSEIEGVHRFTIVVNSSEDLVIKVIKQIEKLVEVILASYYTEDEIIFQEIALYKVPTHALTNGNSIEHIIRDNNARILSVGPEYVVIEKTGHQTETQELFNILEPLGIMQFVRSGRIAVSKDITRLHSYIKELESASPHTEL